MSFPYHCVVADENTRNGEWNTDKTDMTDIHGMYPCLPVSSVYSVCYLPPMLVFHQHLMENNNERFVSEYIAYSLFNVVEIRKKAL